LVWWETESKYAIGVWSLECRTKLKAEGKSLKDIGENKK
jgi:hypothetical protein